MLAFAKQQDRTKQLVSVAEGRPRVPIFESSVICSISTTASVQDTKSRISTFHMVNISAAPRRQIFDDLHKDHNHPQYSDKDSNQRIRSRPHSVPLDRDVTQTSSMAMVDAHALPAMLASDELRSRDICTRLRTPANQAHIAIPPSEAHTEAASRSSSSICIGSLPHASPPLHACAASPPLPQESRRTRQRFGPRLRPLHHAGPDAIRLSPSRLAADSAPPLAIATVTGFHQVPMIIRSLAPVSPPPPAGRDGAEPPRRRARARGPAWLGRSRACCCRRNAAST